MMTATEKRSSGGSSSFLKSLVPWLVIGFVVGVSTSLAKNFLGWDIVEMIGQMFPDHALDRSGVVATTIGGLLVFIALMVAAGATSSSIGKKMQMFADIEDWQDQRKLYWLSAIGCFAWGALLIVLAYGSAAGLPVSAGVLATIVVLFAVLILSCWMLLREFDELWHDINRTSCTWAFYGAFVIGGGWSALAILGFAQALSPLDWISLLTLLSLAGSILGNAKRGTLD